MKELLRRRIGLIIFGAMLLSLVLNFALQTYIARTEMTEDSHMLFKQVENVIKNNVHEQDLVKQEFQDNCLTKALIAADYLERNPESLRDLNVLRRYSLTLDVDEIHIFNAEGKIVAGTIPKYYGMTFNDGLQMSYFLPMLQDKNLHMYQDIFPNTAEKRQMIYAAVWMPDGSAIVQVGMHPKRYLDIVERNDISAVFKNILVDETTTFVAVDVESWRIVGSTNQHLVNQKFTAIGFEPNDIVEGRTGILRSINGVSSYAVFSNNKVNKHLVLCRFVNNTDLYRNAIANSLLLLLYLIVLAIIILRLTNVFLRKEIVDSIDHINSDLSKITKGNLDVRLDIANLPEFAKLSHNINGMVDTLLDVTSKMFIMCRKANLPLGIYEYYASMDRVVATKNVSRLLHIAEDDFQPLLADKTLFEKKLEDIRSHLVNKERNIYKIPWAEAYVRLEFAEHKKGSIGIIVDKTSDFLEKQALEHERDVDIMTGLYTRRKLYYEMQKLFAVPEKVGKAVLVFVDANGLKKINDTYGHEAGDSYLCKIADTLALNIPGNSLACRFGGDEFLAFMYGFSDDAALEQAIAELREAMANCQMTINDTDVAVSASIGVAYYGSDGCSLNELIKNADARMYQDKMQHHRENARL